MGLERSRDISLALAGGEGEGSSPLDPHSPEHPQRPTLGRGGGCTPLVCRVSQGSGLSSLPRLRPQELQGQGLSLQIAPAEELLGRSLNQDACPAAERHDAV